MKKTNIPFCSHPDEFHACDFVEQTSANAYDDAG